MSSKELSLRTKIARQPVMKFWCSLKLTTWSLIFLSFLTFFGTLYQTEAGLYEAQVLYFYSWFFKFRPPGLESFWIPFPGAQLVCWVLTINLMMVSLFRFDWSLRKLGILIMHSGILILLIGGGITYYWAEESQLSLKEGESANFAVAYHDWELSVYQVNEDSSLNVYARDLKDLSVGKSVAWPEQGIHIKMHFVHQNALAYAMQEGVKDEGYVNQAGVAYLQAQEPNSDPVLNTPGIAFGVEVDSKEVTRLMLYGLEPVGTKIPIEQGEWFFQLIRKRFPLQFRVELLDFVKSTHTNTTIASAYESKIKLTQEGLRDKEALVYMNNPFRTADLTFFQASFGQDKMGGESSTLAVVENPGRLIPYISSLVTGFGLMLHFLMTLFRHIRGLSTRRRGNSK